MRLDEKYMEALMKQMNEQGGNNYELYEKTFGVKVLNPDALFGMEFFRGSRDKGSNQLYIIPRKGKGHDGGGILPEHRRAGEHQSRQWNEKSFAAYDKEAGCACAGQGQVHDKG